ncbi:MAG TPA: isoprenylcysteine carboxylmethyltransferase family protein [Hanamia sp.]|nr:isoprenylcysteine carboxylmethyltransferase family protein [Hanamia sp.]
MNHLLVILFWVVYYAVHSILASTFVKDFFQKKLRKYFRYYRLGYSFFAIITLILLLYFQYSFESPIILEYIWVKYFAILFLIFPGLTIMFISIKKYFMLLSGVRSLFTPVPASQLKVNGIHRFVRHPLYSGTILFVWGLFFVFPFLNNLIAVILLTFYVLIGISFEEKKLLKEFGRKYEVYMMNVPMLIPRFRNVKN